MKYFPWPAVFLFAFFGQAIGADGDHDGVEDERDRCPNTAEVKKVDAKFPYASALTAARRLPGPQVYPVDRNGCELDRDGDGVKDSADYCPDDPEKALASGIAPNGCPRQSDGDGTPDYRDKCPDTPRGARTDASGCPI